MDAPSNRPYIPWLRRYVGQQRVFMIGSMACVRDEAGRWLLMRRSDDGNWDFPGGGLELGEDLATNIVREVAEETGLIVEPVRMVGYYSTPEDLNWTYPNGDQVQCVTALFDCRPAGGALHRSDGEALELAFVPPEDIHFDIALLCRMQADLLASQEETIFEPYTQPTGPSVEYISWLRSLVGHAPLLVPAASACIYDDRGRILLQRRRDNGLWGFCGGALNLGESAAQAIVREVREEIGLEVRPARLLGVYSQPVLNTYPNGDQTQPVVALFETVLVGGEPRLDETEVADLAYWPLDSLPPMWYCCQVKAGFVRAGHRAAVF